MHMADNMRQNYVEVPPELSGSMTFRNAEQSCVFALPNVLSLT